ncbi:hypothetical protein [Paraburkholderia nemoris]|uniref:hypothetical protein n=1 Tax=Paraburkholderia nemoris TaxID=2793076 RepID=UPI001B1672B8|nr:hypothetical protein [Paraburkholderia nemoris]CAE6839042.1 hypothetical protein R75777_06978 [Paraburkholderia nemoris]
MTKTAIAAVGLFVCLSLGGCGNDGSPSPPAARDLKPEQIVSFKPNTYACVSEDMFKNAVKWAVEGARTKFQGMFDSLQCIPVPASEKYKVLQVDGDNFELTHADNQATDGMWSAPEFVK